MRRSDLNTQEIMRIIAEHAAAVIPALRNHAFGPKDRLADLGANSMDRAEIVMLTLSTLSLRISLVSTLEAQNIGELADLLHAKL